MDDLISRQAAIDLTWKDPSYSDPLNVLTEVRDGIKALPSVQSKPKTDVLDKIRAEIMSLDIFYDNDYFSSNRDAMFKCSEVLQIIDKYKAESEDKE